jgi:hypothetical protein
LLRPRTERAIAPLRAPFWLMPASSTLASEN